MLDCPVCKNRDVRDTVCRRCRADLTMLFAIERQRQRCLAECQMNLRARRLDAAADWLDEAMELRQDSATHRLAALLSLLRGDYPSAWESYLRMHPPAEIP